MTRGQVSMGKSNYKLLAMTTRIGRRQQRCPLRGDSSHPAAWGQNIPEQSICVQYTPHEPLQGQRMLKYKCALDSIYRTLIAITRGIMFIVLSYL